MKKYKKKELIYILAFDREHQQKVGIPNDIFKILSQDQELNKSKSPHVAYAYAFIFLTAWLYKYGKYSLPFETTNMSHLKEIIGISPIGKSYNYIFKKNGVLDRLQITKTIGFKEAPVEYVWEDGFFCGFVTYQEWLDRFDSGDLQEIKDVGAILNSKRKHIKYPIFGLEKRIVNGEEVEGTFYEWGYTHAVPMDVFIECMTNKELGAVAFYIYSYLCSRCDMNEGSVEVSLDKIKSITGIKHTTLNLVLNNLKAFNLIQCRPANFVINKGSLETGASKYKVIKDPSNFYFEPENFERRKVIYRKEEKKQSS